MKAANTAKTDNRSSSKKNRSKGPHKKQGDKSKTKNSWVSSKTSSNQHQRKPLQNLGNEWPSIQAMSLSTDGKLTEDSMKSEAIDASSHSNVSSEAAFPTLAASTNTAAQVPSTNLSYNHRPNQWRNPQTQTNQSYANYKRQSSYGQSYGNQYSSNRRRHVGTSHKYHQTFDPEQYIPDLEQQTVLTDSLQKILHSHGVYEDGVQSQKRLEVLSHLQDLLRQWTSNHNESNQSIKVISFGSYRLGVHAPDADMDLLALCPSSINVTKDDFFSSFVDLLKNDERCSKIHPIAKAYTPVVKFYVDELPVDLLFVKLVHDGEGWDDSAMAASSDNEFQIQDVMLKGLDEPSSRSLNGVRVAQYLLNVIPNLANFRLVLKTVKEWAQVHGLYSNVLGFLGGINWGILVAWVCVRHPEASVPTLLKLFFHTFARWRWPKPVILTPIVKNPPPGVTPKTVWNPAVNPRDRGQLMPIITPCYPSMNSSYNVGNPQLRRLREEMHRADKIMNELPHGNADWSDLLKVNDFFSDHAHFLQVRISTENSDDHQAWFGLCESRLRILIAGLESTEHGTIAYPFTKFFQRKMDDCVKMEDSGKDSIPNGIVTYSFIALRFAEGLETVDIIECTNEFTYMVNSWEGRKPGMDLRIDHVLQSNLPSFVFEGGIDENDKKETSQMEGDGVVDGLMSPFEKKTSIKTLHGRRTDVEESLASPLKRHRRA